MLINYGIRINATDNDRSTALHLNAVNGKYSFIIFRSKKLLEIQSHALFDSY